MKKKGERKSVQGEGRIPHAREKEGATELAMGYSRGGRKRKGREVGRRRSVG